MYQLIVTSLKCPAIRSFRKLLEIIACQKESSRSNAKQDSFLGGTSARYIELMYQVWKKDPSQVHPSWDAFFRLSQESGSFVAPPTLGHTNPNVARRASSPASTSKPIRSPRASAPVSASPAAASSSSGKHATNTDVEKHLAVQHIIRGYQVRGHFLAQIDPLGLMNGPRKSKPPGLPPDIISPLKLSAADMDKVFTLPYGTSIGGKEKALPLKEIIKRLEDAYCKTIGIEFMFINSVRESNWIRDRFEKPGVTKISNDKKKLCLARLARAQLFENFCAKKHPSEKRFGLEGLEVLVPCMKTIIDRSSELGVEMFVIGMAHRGRLNALVNVCRKSLVQMFAQFEGLKPEDEMSTGDIKYHLGVFVQRMNRVTNKNVKIVIIANPSHLETSSPVVIGRVRAEHFFSGDTEGKKTLGILLHGDASFTGQGVNFEVINVANLPCYTTHGTIHIVTNNQIGFTTDRKVAGSSPYCTDLGRVINSPIFHVNADDPEAVVYTSEVACDWRNKFKKDVVIDIVGYRKHGHQEVDDPYFTQPVLYSKVIKKMKPCFEKYAEKLIKEKVVTAAEVKAIKDDYEKILETDFAKAKKEKKIKMKDWLDSPWPGFFEGKDPKKMMFPTGVPEDVLVHISKAISSPPPGSDKFILHKALQRVLNTRAELLSKRIVDFAMAESIAYGSLLKQGIHVRLTGEDVERGTFSHRHHIYHHQTVESEKYCPIANLYPDQAKYTICNSTLAEYAIMGYEHGYSMTSPNALVLWEAQFGDFSNTAQPILDQMISSGEAKWCRQCGMVLLMPHGLEGQGPEHSSVRPERFVDMICEDAEKIPPIDTPNYSLEQLRHINWIVVICSTPSNHFHALRRQMAMPFRKPLVMFTPKGILRNPVARSSFDLMLPGTKFMRVIPDAGPASKAPQEVKKLIFCAGKVYYEAARIIKENKIQSKIAVCRIEQLGPFPFDLVQKQLEKYPNAKVHWLQEEHKNQGFWDHMEPRLRNILRHMGDCRDKISYIGRAISASTASGYKYQFQQEHKQLLADILKIKESD